MIEEQAAGEFLVLILTKVCSSSLLLLPLLEINGS
jgi:hypothetical protein